jgi:hypothetical protein
VIEVPWRKEAEKLPLIKVVGTSAAGKSTLVRKLREAGYNAQPVSQEHSEVPALWQQFEPPNLLIYLEIDLAGQRGRRQDVSWDRRALQREQRRLRHAREHADLRIKTSEMTEDAVFQVALAYLQHQKVAHHDEPLPPVAATGSFRKDRPADES